MSGRRFSASHLSAFAERVLRAAGDWAATLPDSGADGCTSLPQVDARALLLRVP